MKFFRNGKRLLAAALVLAMLFSMNIAAFADSEEGSGSAAVGRNAMSSLPNMKESFFEQMGFASVVGGGSSKYFAEDAAAPAGIVFWFLNMTEELDEYVDDDCYVNIPYEAYMNLANAYFTNAPEMKTFFVNSEFMDEQTEQIRYYLGGVGSDWAWVLCGEELYYDSDAGAYGYKLRGIFCDGQIADTTGLTEYVDYYVVNGAALAIDSAVELTLVNDQTYGYRIAAYTEKNYYLADTADMGDCIYAYNETTGSFSDVYYCIYSNSGDYGIVFEYEDGTCTSMDNYLCYAPDQEVVWETAYNGSAAYDYKCGEVTVVRTFEGGQIVTITGDSGVISGGGEVLLWSTPCVEFEIQAPHCTVEVLQGLDDRGDGTYFYREGDTIELKITPDADYEITEVASFLYDVYVVTGSYISAGGTWQIFPEFIPSTILVSTKEASPAADITVDSSEDSVADITVRLPEEYVEVVGGLTLVAREPDEAAKETAISLIASGSDAGEEDVRVLDIHFENADGEETAVNAKMLVTVPIPEGWDPSNVDVFYVNTDTGEVVDMNAVVSDDGKTVSFTTDHFSYYALVQAKDGSDNDNEDYPFTDVDTSGKHAPFADAILWAANEGITTGYGNGIFKPDLDCSRAQVVTFLWRAAGCPEPKSTKKPFVDVSAKNADGKDNPYYTAILWAVGEGITLGVDKTHFAPNDTVTRAHVVTFIYRDMA